MRSQTLHTGQLFPDIVFSSIACEARRSSCGAQVNEAKGPAGLGEVRKAYEYSADRIGQGAGAGPLWAEYLAFLQARPDAGHADGSSVRSPAPLHCRRLQRHLYRLYSVAAVDRSRGYEQESDG